MKRERAAGRLICLGALLLLLPAASAAVIAGGARVARAGVRQGQQAAASVSVRRIFEADASLAGCTLTGCAAAPDGAYGLSAVAQYTSADGNPCWLGFVREGALQPVGLSADSMLQVQPGSALHYAGDGVVTLSLSMKQAPGVVYDYTVRYTRTADKTNISVQSEVRR